LGCLNVEEFALREGLFARALIGAASRREGLFAQAVIWVA